MMDPEQAALAAELLRTEQLVPMHYGANDLPGVYESVQDAVERGAGLLVDGLDDLGAADPAQIRGSDPEVRVTELSGIPSRSESQAGAVEHRSGLFDAADDR